MGALFIHLGCLSYGLWERFNIHLGVFTLFRAFDVGDPSGFRSLNLGFVPGNCVCESVEPSPHGISLAIWQQVSREVSFLNESRFGWE